MAGLSSRFIKSGYTLPKYMLYVKDKSLFTLSVSSFEKYFKSCKFIFVARNLFDTPRFIEEECRMMGIEDFQIIVTEPTKGQAETVFKGLEGANISDDESILIFNIDTIRPNFMFPESLKNCDGYLECFVGEGSNWSYAKTENGTPEAKVIETAEKKPISNFCSTGIYYFSKAKDFIEVYRNNEVCPNNEVKELYVAPLYNYLISKGETIRVNIIPKEDVIFCGVPNEYVDFLKEQLLTNK